MQNNAKAHQAKPDKMHQQHTVSETTEPEDFQLEDTAEITAEAQQAVMKKLPAEVIEAHDWLDVNQIVTTGQSTSVTFMGTDKQNLTRWKQASELITGLQAVCTQLVRKEASEHEI